MKKPFLTLPRAALFAACLLPAFAACATNPAPPEPVPSELSAPALPIGRAEVRAPEPRVEEPGFTIASIAVLQADLINTCLKVRVRVDNPNSFPLELSALSYELYGGGRLWADGTETAVMPIPPGGFAEKDLFLPMNFMNMTREVLDQIIALRAVRYRFSGEAALTTGIETLPRFTMGFDLAGESPVAR
jgi:LEA14-like dessication related protein